MIQEPKLSNGSVRYIAQTSGLQDIIFGGKGRLSFDTTQVNTSRVAEDKLLAEEERGASGVCVAIEISSQRADPTIFPAEGQAFQAYGRAYDFEPKGLYFEKPAILTLPYSATEGMNEPLIDIYNYNEENSMWEAVPKVSQDIANKTITVEISHFSDYVAGMSSFRVDEGGSIDAGGQLASEVDPYLGTLLLKSNEAFVASRGVDLAIEARFNSDYLYKKYVSVFSGGQTPVGTETTAGRTLVKTPTLKYPFAGTDISSGWSYAMPYAQFDTYNRLYLTMPSGAYFDLSSFVKSWVTMSVGHVEDNGQYRINKPSSGALKVLIPGERCGLEITLHNASVFLSTRGQVDTVKLYNDDASYWYFPSTGNVQYLYDASGKNYLHYVYSSGSILQKVEHSDGRAIKIYSYTNNSSQLSLVYVLSSSTSMTTITAEDQFIARRVFDTNAASTARLLYADKLQTAASITPSTSWGGVTASNETTYFSVLQRTTYAYSMNSTVTGNTLSITEPGEGFRQYTFAISFFPGIRSEKTTTQSSGDGESIVTYYKLYHNKPKVCLAVKKASSTATEYEHLSYAYACNYGSVPVTFTTSSYDSEAEIEPPLRNTMPYNAVLEKMQYSGSNGTNVIKETIGFSHGSSGNFQYMGIGEDDVQMYTGSAWVSKEKTVRTFWSSNYEFYKPATEKVYKNATTPEKWTLTNTYDAYGRLIRQHDSRPDIQTGAYTYWYYLYYGEAQSVFAYPFTIPSSRTKYSAFGLLGGSASQQSSSVTSVSYSEYDSLMNITKRRMLDTRSGNPVTLDTEFAYDAATNVLTAIMYPEDNVLTLNYGTGWKASYITKDSRVLGSNANIVNVFDYDLRGRATSKTQKLVAIADGSDIIDTAAPIATTTYSYDGLNRVTSRFLTTGGVTTELYRRSYDDTNLAVTTTDSKGYRTVASYDQFFRKIAQERFRPDTENRDATYTGSDQISVAKIVWTYDPVYRDNIITETTNAVSDGSSWYRTKNVYDNLGRVIEVDRWNQGAYSKVGEISYDDSANTVREKRYRNASEFTEILTSKDWRDRVMSVSQYAGVGGTGVPSVTSTTYNWANQPITKILANGESYQYSYSRAGLFEEMVYPQSRGTESYGYDANGRLTQRVDAGGNTTSYTYNAADFEIGRSSSALGKDTVGVTKSYTQYGPKEVIQTRGGNEDIRISYSYSYNSGALAAMENRQIAGVGTSVVFHGYDVAGNFKTLSVTGFDGNFSKTVDYSLPYFGGDGSASDRWMKVSIGGLALGKVSTHYSGPKNVVQHWNGQNMITDMVFRYYDDFLRPGQMDYNGADYDQNYSYDWQGNITSWNGAVYAYDGMERLTTGGYQYDIMGNQTAAPSSTTYGYLPFGNYNSMRLDSRTVGGVTTDYQDDGNLANLTAAVGKYTGLTYDATNRLISLYDVARSVTDSYRYGPEGLRYKKTEGTETTYYLYEGNELLLEETYVGGSRTSSKLNVFLGGMNLGRVQKVGGTENKQYFYIDHLGSRRAVLDGTGAVQAKIEYSIWGVPTVTNYNGYDGSKDISFTGKERDATGLYYFNARYYDASIGRFITEDPARNGMNWFVYCRNNPVRFTDPAGLEQAPYGPFVTALDSFSIVTTFAEHQGRNVPVGGIDMIAATNEHVKNSV